MVVFLFLGLVLFFHGLFAQGLGPLIVIGGPLLGFFQSHEAILIVNLLCPMVGLFLSGMHTILAYRQAKHAKQPTQALALFKRFQWDRGLEAICLFLGAIPGIFIGGDIFVALVNNPNLMWLGITCLEWIKIIAVAIVLVSIIYRYWPSRISSPAKVHSPFFLGVEQGRWRHIMLGLGFGMVAGLLLSLAGLCGLVELAYGFSLRRWSHEDSMLITQNFLFMSALLIVHQYKDMFIAEAGSFKLAGLFFAYSWYGQCLIIAALIAALVVSCYYYRAWSKKAFIAQLGMDVSMIIFSYLALYPLLKVSVLYNEVALVAVVGLIGFISHYVWRNKAQVRQAFAQECSLPA